METICIANLKNIKSKPKEQDNGQSEYIPHFLLINGYSRMYLTNNYDDIIEIILNYYYNHDNDNITFEECDIYQLFNGLQFDFMRYNTQYDTKYENGFFDLRLENEYKQKSILQSINMPFNILNNIQLIDKKLENFKHLSFKNIYLFSGNKIYIKH